jgi:hypothetical protein
MKMGGTAEDGLSSYDERPFLHPFLEQEVPGNATQTIFPSGIGTQVAAVLGRERSVQI